MGRKIIKELSIIITCWNHYDYTINCIAHIFNSSYPKEKLQIILVDNASTDKTESLVEYLLNKSYPIIYLKQKENMGFVKGNNIGYKYANTPYVMLLNNDAFVDISCIDIMMRVIKSNEKIGAVGAIEYDIHNRLTKGDKPFIFFKPKTLLDPELKSLQNLNLDEKTEFVDVDIVGSACSIFRKSANPNDYVFDEIFHPAHFDQEDLWMRVKQNGYRIVMPTKATFQHVIAGTTSIDLQYYNKVLYENKLKFLKKWLK